ncbi:MAG: hypothetical protein E6L05_02355 [Thaumarchaeota archaeon]|nr:MAG: hypothetical protein E6L05_02355 [Nitrososphaerota archaeon]
MSTKVGKKQSAIAAAVTISYMILASSSVVFLDMGLQQAFGGTFPGTNGKIAFDSDRTGTEQIFVMNADGSGQTNLSNNAFFDASPSWSPDGTKISFHHGNSFGGSSQIFVMNADGSGQINLSNNAFNDNLPDWGPLAAPRQGQTVGGIIEPIDMTSLFIAGIFTNAFWMVPTLGGIAGAIVALFNVKRKRDD